MKKLRDHLPEIILLMISVFLLLLMVAPYLMGFKVQQDYETILQTVSQQTGMQPEAVIYDRGWFSTDVRTILINPEKQPVAIFDQKIIHGPLYLGLLLKGYSPWVNMVIQGQVYSAEETSSALLKLFDKQHPVSVWASVDFSSNAQFTLDLPLLDTKLENAALRFSGFKLVMKYQNAENRLTGETSIEQGAYLNSNYAEFNNVVISFDQRLQDKDLLGDLVLSVGRLKFRIQSEQFDFYQLSTRLQNQYVQNSLAYSLNLNASRVHVLNEQLNGLAFTAQLNKVKAGLFDSWRENYSAETFSSGYFNLLSHFSDASVLIDPLSFYSEQGQFNSRFEARFNQADLFKEQNLLSKLEVKLDITIAELLFKNLYEGLASHYDLQMKDGQAYAAQLIKHYYLDPANHHYRLSFSNSEHKPMINSLLVSYEDLVQNFNLAELFEK